MDASLESTLRRLLPQKNVPGLSLATLRAGAVDEVLALGSRGAHDPSPVDSHTVFEAASLTKPVVAYLALLLVDAGRLDLDAPMAATFAEYLPADERGRAITPWHVLTHTSGLPNLVSEATPLRTYFAPGERFSYSGNGFGFLQREIERISGLGLQALAERAVFEPFGMEDSCLHWLPRYEANHAQGHDWDGQPEPKRRVERPHASWTLLTTATDYARFLQAAVLQGRGLSPAALQAWFAPAVHPPLGGEAEDLPGVHPRDPDTAWGLGWGLEPAQQCCFHWGHSPGFRAFVIADRARHDAVVWFANAAGGLRLAHEILPLAMPGNRPSLRWLRPRR